MAIAIITLAVVASTFMSIKLIPLWCDLILVLNRAASKNLHLCCFLSSLFCNETSNQRATLWQHSVLKEELCPVCVFCFFVFLLYVAKTYVVRTIMMVFKKSNNSRSPCSGSNSSFLSLPDISHPANVSVWAVCVWLSENQLPLLESLLQWTHNHTLLLTSFFKNTFDIMIRRRPRV